MSLDISGLYPPIPTPFETDGSIDYNALAQNLNVWNKFDLAGYVVMGSNGEFVYLSTDEKVDIVEHVRKNIPKNKKILAGCGCEGTLETIRMCERMAEVGADAALVINPSYYKKGMTNKKVLLNYFSQVADLSPIPVILYNMPGNTTIDIPNDVIVKLSRHPNIIGIKDSGGKVSKIGYMCQECPGFQVLAGSASFLAPALCLGAVGGVCALANIAPQQILDMMSLVKQGKLTPAFAIQKRMIEPNTAVTAGFGIPGLKHALDHLGMLGGSLRGPLMKIDDETIMKLESILRKAGIGHVLQSLDNVPIQAKL